MGKWLEGRSPDGARLQCQLAGTVIFLAPWSGLLRRLQGPQHLRWPCRSRIESGLPEAAHNRAAGLHGTAACLSTRIFSTGHLR